jgi:hypothetical protein
MAQVPISRKRKREISAGVRPAREDRLSRGCLALLAPVNLLGLLVYYGYSVLGLLLAKVIGMAGKAEMDQETKNSGRADPRLYVIALKIVLPLAIGWGCLYALKKLGERHFEDQRLEFLYVGTVAIIVSPFLYVWRSQIADLMGI